MSSSSSIFHSSFWRVEEYFYLVAYSTGDSKGYPLFRNRGVAGGRMQIFESNLADYRPRIHRCLIRRENVFFQIFLGDKRGRGWWGGILGWRVFTWKCLRLFIYLFIFKFLFLRKSFDGILILFICLFINFIRRRGIGPGYKYFSFFL